jgi:prevent-host-death family protein
MTKFGHVLQQMRGQTMNLSNRIKPISHLKANAAEIVNNLDKQAEPLIITQKGVAKAVIQGIESYEKMQETMALLKILALGARQIEKGNVTSADKVFERLRT